MTDEQLAEIEARAAAATLGEWEVSKSDWAGEYAVKAANGLIVLDVIHTNALEEKENLQFAAHARTDIPALIAEVRRLRAENKSLRAFMPDD